MSNNLPSQKTIVISAVNLNVGGTLAILRDCLGYLSELADHNNYRVVALVYKQELACFPNIDYIETQWPKKHWLNRLWFEYVSMKNISRQIGPVYLWLSLHDTTPNVVAERKAVYCHNPFPFYCWHWRDCFFAPKIVLFALFSKMIYQINIHRNDMVIVQQSWLKDAFKQLFKLSEDKIVVAIPESRTERPSGKTIQTHEEKYTFIYAASPNSHKNFECICQAVEILQEEEGLLNFKVYITISGKENKYAKWLAKKWKHLSAMDFIGFVDKTTLFGYYASCNSLIFPSRVETWGLPISEFSMFHKPMLLADLPYAYETAAGCKLVSFFKADCPDILADQMRRLILGDESFLKTILKPQIQAPVAYSWNELFHILLQSEIQ